MPRKLGWRKKKSYETGLMKDPKSMDIEEKRINGLPYAARMMAENDCFISRGFERRFKEKHPNPRYDSLLVMMQRRRLDELRREDRARYRQMKEDERMREEYSRRIESGELSEDDVFRMMYGDSDDDEKDKKEKGKRKKN